MKNKYISMKISLIFFASEDVITLSAGANDSQKDKLRPRKSRIFDDGKFENCPLNFRQIHANRQESTQKFLESEIRDNYALTA